MPMHPRPTDETEGPVRPSRETGMRMPVRRRLAMNGMARLAARRPRAPLQPGEPRAGREILPTTRQPYVGVLTRKGRVRATLPSPRRGPASKSASNTRAGLLPATSSSSGRHSQAVAAGLPRLVRRERPGALARRDLDPAAHDLALPVVDGHRRRQERAVERFRKADDERLARTGRGRLERPLVHRWRLPIGRGHDERPRGPASEGAPVGVAPAGIDHQPIATAFAERRTVFQVRAQAALEAARIEEHRQAPPARIPELLLELQERARHEVPVRVEQVQVRPRFARAHRSVEHEVGAQEIRRHTARRSDRSGPSE